MALNNSDSQQKSPDEFYDDNTKYMIRRDNLVQEGFSLSFSYSREIATELNDHIETTRKQLEKSGCKVIQVSCDLQTALYYKRD